MKLVCGKVSVTLTSCRAVFRFGGGPAINHLYLCTICQGELERLKCRQKYEMDKFVQVSVHCWSVVAICRWSLLASTGSHQWSLIAVCQYSLFHCWSVVN